MIGFAAGFSSIKAPQAHKISLIISHLDTLPIASTSSSLSSPASCYVTFSKVSILVEYWMSDLPLLVLLPLATSLLLHSIDSIISMTTVATSGDMANHFDTLRRLLIKINYDQPFSQSEYAYYHTVLYHNSLYATMIGYARVHHQYYYKCCTILCWAVLIDWLDATHTHCVLFVYVPSNTICII